MDLEVIEDPEESEHPCKGVVYRCRKSLYMDAKGSIINCTKMIPLKRRSCKGCVKCGWENEEITMRLQDDSLSFDNAEDGKLYQLYTYNLHRDWETGTVDDYDCGFREVKTLLTENQISNPDNQKKNG